MGHKKPPSSRAPILTGALLLCLGLSLASGSAHAQQDHGILDLNEATEGQLDELPGIGPAKARAIITWRDTHGAFAEPDQLLDVSGIGPATYAGLCGLVRVGETPGCGSPADSRDEDTAAPAAQPPVAPLSDRQTRGAVNLNLGNAEALQQLPRIGPSLADRIVQFRARNGLFTSVEDLTGVSGIGTGTLDQLRPLVTLRADLNALTAGELRRLGVPAPVAEDIIAYRAAHGPFASLASLVEVDGVSELLVSHLVHFVWAGEEN